MGDGKETFSVDPLAVKPCFEDGQTLPSVSSAFTILSLKDLTPTKDKYGPLGSAGTRDFVSWSFLLGFAALLLYGAL